MKKKRKKTKSQMRIEEERKSPYPDRKTNYKLHGFDHRTLGGYKK